MKSNCIYRLIIIYTIFFINGCVNTEVDTSEGVDYDELTELTSELVIEIGESEDYIPGHLQDLVLMLDGTMLVSDFSNTVIEQFGPEGDYIGTVAKRGNGPGELPSFFSLKDGGDDIFLVYHLSAQKIDTYGRSESGVYAYRKSIIFGGTELVSMERRMKDIIFRNSSEFVVTTTGAIPRELLMQSEPQYIQEPVVLLDSLFHIVQDSLYMLKVSGPMYSSNPNDPMSTVISADAPYQFEDHIKFLGNGRYVIARADSSALYHYNQNYDHEKTTRLHIQPRPVEQPDQEYFIGYMRPDVYQRMEERVGEFKPPFLDLWLSEDHIWLLSDESEAGQEIVVFTIEGDPVGKFVLPEIDDIRYFRGDRIYTINRNREVGHTVRIYQVGL